jgi:hypothetical protein
MTVFRVLAWFRCDTDEVDLLGDTPYGKPSRTSYIYTQLIH